MWVKDCYFLISGHELRLSSHGNFQDSLQEIIFTSFCPNPTNIKEGILYAQNIPLGNNAILPAIKRGNLKKQTLLYFLHFFDRRGFMVLGIWFFHLNLHEAKGEFHL